MIACDRHLLWQVTPPEEVDTRPWDCYDIETWEGDVIAASLDFKLAERESHSSTTRPSISCWRGSPETIVRPSAEVPPLQRWAFSRLSKITLSRV